MQVSLARGRSAPGGYIQAGLSSRISSSDIDQTGMPSPPRPPESPLPRDRVPERAHMAACPSPLLGTLVDVVPLVGRLADVVDFDGWRRRRLRRHHLHRPEDLREAEGVSPTLNSLTPTLPTHAAGEAPEEPRMPASHPSVRAPTCVCVHVWWLYRVVRDANRSLAPGGVAWHAGSHS